MDDIVTGGGGAAIYRYSGEPDLQAYLAAGGASALRVEHLIKPDRPSRTTRTISW